MSAKSSNSNSGTISERFTKTYAERRADFNRAAEIKFGKLPAVQAEIDRIQKELAEAQKSGAMLREEVTPDEIAEVVSRWTGIPVTKLVESEKQKLLQLDLHLHQRVVGQDEAVRLVAEVQLKKAA